MKLPSWIAPEHRDWKRRLKDLLQQSLSVTAIWAWLKFRLGHDLDWAALGYLLLNPVFGMLGGSAKPAQAVVIGDATLQLPDGRVVEWKDIRGVRERQGALSLVDRAGWPLAVIPYNTANIDDLLRELVTRMPPPDATRLRRFGRRYSIRVLVPSLIVGVPLVGGVYWYTHDIWTAVVLAVVVLWGLPRALREGVREIVTAHDELLIRSVLRETRVSRRQIRDVALTAANGGLRVVGVLEDGEQLGLSVPGVKPLDLYYAVKAWVRG